MALSSEKALASNYNKSETQHCQFCGKECKSKNSLIQHEIRCKENPNRKCFNNLKYFAGQKLKGKTKDNCEYIQHQQESFYSNKEKGLHVNYHSTGAASTLEKEIQRRQHISSTAKINKKSGGLRVNSGRGKKGIYKGYYCDSTYELVYIIYNIDHNIKFERCTLKYDYECNGEKHKYHPDFILEDGSLVEIKGYMRDVDLIKLNSVKDRPIKLLFEKDLKYAFDYVKQNYIYNKLTDLYEN
jgi:hypothetical protein